MTGLGQWMTGALNRHIERNNVEARELAPVGPDHTDEPIVERCCWACGDPRGFHAPHWPCWKVPPFTRNAETPQRTYGAGGAA